MYDIRIYNSISLIEKENWDALTENNIFMCYEYLKTFEETIVFPLMPFYITVNDQEKIIGASPCYLEQKNEGRSIDKVILGKRLKYGGNKISFLPALICNRQRGDGTHFIFYPGLKDDQKLLLQNKMLDEIDRIAENNKVSACFLNITDDEVQLIKSLKQRGYYQSLDLPSNFIDIKWSSFEGYLQYLSGKYSNIKRTIKHELNRNRKSGVVIVQFENLNGYEERLLELVKMNHFKYNSTMFPFKQNYIQRIKNNFGNNAVIYAAMKDGIIIGVSVELRRGKEAFFASTAVDHELSQNDFTFFNIGYYEPLKYAIQCRLSRIYFGRGLYESKARRGCTPKSMSIFYKPKYRSVKPAVQLWFGFHKWWMKRKLAYINEL
jgi:predicted N-acyltransferase